MANGNTNPGIGESADSGVMHNPQPSRARTHARVVSPTGILKESLTVLPGAHARVREESADFTAWRVKTFGGNFDPVREAVEDAVVGSFGVSLVVIAGAHPEKVLHILVIGIS